MNNETKDRDEKIEELRNNPKAFYTVYDEPYDSKPWAGITSEAVERYIAGIGGPRNETFSEACERFQEAFHELMALTILPPVTWCLIRLADGLEWLVQQYRNENQK